MSLTRFDLQPCLDVYADDEEIMSFFNDSYKGTKGYSTTGWYCFPNGTEIIVQNDPWVSRVGVTTGFAVDHCIAGN